ncbi:uncharacterized protein [Rutidosis leptorrhynchoides]|uniref:uncharacterized protein n=1 Tax=Rutidosis leptorrhynchoides TaxID=125765 RepID=UPI003A98FCDA
MISGFVFNNSGVDEWRWTLAPNGKLTTKKLHSIIEEKINEGNSLHIETHRNPLVSKKIEIFIWRARLRRLAVRVELDKRGVNLHSVLCPICNDVVESVEHSLILCKFAMEVWERVCKWWGFANVVSLSISEAFLGKSSQHLSPLQILIWQAVEWSTGYLIWKNRNQKVFKDKSWSGPMALNEIQVISFEWISRRIKGKSIDWLTWLSNPKSCVL